MQWLYLVCLLLSIGGIAALDWRYKLAFWHNFKRATLTILFGLSVFIAWDLIAIDRGVFIHGDSPYALSFTLLPEFPLEEIFFLILLCYSALALYRGAQKLWPRT